MPTLITLTESLGHNNGPIIMNSAYITTIEVEKRKSGEVVSRIHTINDDTFVVKETPVEIVKLIKEAESDRIKQKMDTVVEHRKEMGLPLPMALPLPILAAL